MAIEKTKSLLPAWGCVTTAVDYTALAAFRAAGETAVRQDVAEVDSEESWDEFAAWFSILIPVKGLINAFRRELGELLARPLTRSIVRDCAYEALHTVVLEQVTQN
jgi:hypothetical protein